MTHFFPFRFQCLKSWFLANTYKHQNPRLFDAESNIIYYIFMEKYKQRKINIFFLSYILTDATQTNFSDSGFSAVEGRSRPRMSSLKTSN